MFVGHLDVGRDVSTLVRRSSLSGDTATESTSFWMPFGLGHLGTVAVVYWVAFRR